MSGDSGTGALAVDVEVADMEFTFCALDLFAVPGVNRAGQAKFGVIGNLERVIVILDLITASSGPKTSSCSRRDLGGISAMTVGCRKYPSPAFFRRAAAGDDASIFLPTSM